MKRKREKNYHENYLRRVALVQRITDEHYEPGRLDRCYAHVWRYYVYPVVPCCYHTYLSMLKVDVDKERKQMTEAVSKPQRRWVIPNIFGMSAVEAAQAREG